MRALVLTQCVDDPKSDLIGKFLQGNTVRIRIIMGPVLIEHLMVTRIGGVLVILPGVVRQKQDLDVRIRRVDCVQSLSPVQFHGLHGFPADSRDKDLSLFPGLDCGVLRHGRNRKLH